MLLRHVQVHGNKNQLSGAAHIHRDSSVKELYYIMTYSIIVEYLFFRHKYDKMCFLENKSLPFLISLLLINNLSIIDLKISFTKPI